MPDSEIIGNYNYDQFCTNKYILFGIVDEEIDGIIYKNGKIWETSEPISTEFIQCRLKIIGTRFDVYSNSLKIQKTVDTTINGYTNYINIQQTSDRYAAFKIAIKNGKVVEVYYF